MIGLERKVRDSCGNTRQRETPQAQVRRGGSRTARGKRVPGVEINIRNGRYETPAGIRVKGRPHRRKCAEEAPGPPAESECLEWKSTLD
ncbi:hypothetical protein FOA20_25860 [Peribacillus simplex]